MSISDFFSQGLALTGNFNVTIMVFLFLLCFLGEAIGFFVPYLFETTWLLIGYQLSQRVLPIPDFLLLLVTSMAGREAGTLVLCYLSRKCSPLLTRYKDRFASSTSLNESLPVKLFRKADFLKSPFLVAVGRLFWLRIPLTLLLGAQMKLKVLLLGVAISSLVYEGIFVSLGAIFGTTAKVGPVHLVLYSLAALTILYVATFIIRRLVRLVTKRWRLVAVKEEVD